MKKIPVYIVLTAMVFLLTAMEAGAEEVSSEEPADETEVSEYIVETEENYEFVDEKLTEADNKTLGGQINTASDLYSEYQQIIESHIDGIKKYEEYWNSDADSTLGSKTRGKSVLLEDILGDTLEELVIRSVEDNVSNTFIYGCLDGQVELILEVDDDNGIEEGKNQVLNAVGQKKIVVVRNEDTYTEYYVEDGKLITGEPVGKNEDSTDGALNFMLADIMEWGVKLDYAEKILIPLGENSGKDMSLSDWTAEKTAEINENTVFFDILNRYADAVNIRNYETNLTKLTGRSSGSTQLVDTDDDGADELVVSAWSGTSRYAFSGILDFDGEKAVLSKVWKSTEVNEDEIRFYGVKSVPQIDVRNMEHFYTTSRRLAARCAGTEYDPEMPVRQQETEVPEKLNDEDKVRYIVEYIRNNNYGQIITSEENTDGLKEILYENGFSGIDTEWFTDILGKIEKQK